MEGLEKAGLIAAMTGAALGAAAESPKVDSAQADNGNKTEQISEFHGETTKIQKGEDGKDFIVINGKKFILAPEAIIGKAETPKFESKGSVVLGSSEEKPIQITALDESK
jgi:hypothetical protein